MRARPSATRWRSPPESRAGRRASRSVRGRASRRPRPSVSRRVRARREPVAVGEVLAHGQVREQPRLLRDVADAPAIGRHHDAARPCRRARRRRGRSCRASGRISPATTCSSVVLPAPDGPTIAVRPRAGPDRTSSAMRSRRWRTSTARLIAAPPSAAPARRRRRARRTRRATESAASRQHAGVAARRLRQRVDGERQRLRLARDVRDERDRGAELAEGLGEAEDRAGEDARARPAAA